MDEREKVQARLDELGYSPDSHRLEAYTDRHALLLLHSATGLVILNLHDGNEVATFVDRPAALESFTIIASRDAEARKD